MACLPPPHPAQVASHRLSTQVHYDFALRSLKAVLTIAAELRNASTQLLDAKQEESLCRVALLRCNNSKLKVGRGGLRCLNLLALPVVKNLTHLSLDFSLSS